MSEITVNKGGGGGARTTLTQMQVRAPYPTSVIASKGFHPKTSVTVGHARATL